VDLCVFRGTEEELGEACGIYLLVLLKQHGPGRRPWRWWEYFAPEKHRRRIDPRGAGPAGERWAFGVPFQLEGSALAGVRDWPCFESELDYLRRHRLLLPGEESTCG